MSRNPDVQRLLASLREGGLIGNALPASTTASTPRSNDWSRQSYGSALITPDTSGTVDARWHEHGIPTIPEANASRMPISPQQERTSEKTAPDSSQITTWPLAVKFVSKYIVSDENAAAKIKRLITEQHRHERDWWEKRELVIRKHTGRVENQQKAAELLRSLGGQYIPVEPTDPQIDLAELEEYDRKVHRSLTQMVAHHDQELRKLGVPFFAIRHNLVVPDKVKDDETVTKGRLSAHELRELQQRLVVHLEDLFGEENG